jgi:Domain of unknown function (DUF4157)
MKVSEAKINSTGVHLQKKANEPFFNKRAGESFFSKSNDTPKDFFRPPSIQTKLTIGQPNDIYEKEADAMADKVVQRQAIPEVKTQREHAVQTKPRATSFTPSVQTKCEHCEEEDKIQKSDEMTYMGLLKNKVQTKPIFGNGAPPDDIKNVQRQCAECEKEEKLQKKADNLTGRNSSGIESRLNSSKGSGSALPHATREQMETSFGADFSNVRIHNDSSAVQMNKDLNAQAFAHGSDIYFNSGKYDASSKGGKQLLAHELTHTIQQKKSGFTPVLRKEIKQHGEGKAPDDVIASCDGVADATPGVEKEQKIPQVQYAIESDKINPLIIVAINEFVKQWHVRGGKETVDIFGYASTDGAEEFNWRLSCRRANSLKDILLRPTDGTPGIPVGFITTHAQGETEKFGSGEVENRVATIVSVIPLKPAEVCPPCDQTGVRPASCAPCTNILPDVPIPVDPVGPLKPKDSPAFFCVPYTDMAQANRDHTLVEAEMQLFTSRFGKDVQDLWTTYLENPKTGTKGTLLPRKIFAVQNSRVVNEFRQDDETLKQKDRIMKLLAEKIRSDSTLMPAVGQSTPLLNFRAVLANADLLNLPMSFKDPANKIPGNIAGGFGKNSSDAGDDVRNVDGTFIATNLGLSTIKISAAFTFDVLDAVDFCPGAPGGFFAQRVSVPMSRFEATPNFPTYDVPFEVIYGLSDDQSF